TDLEQQQAYYEYIRTSKPDYYNGFERSEAPINEAMMAVLSAIEDKYTKPATNGPTPPIEGGGTIDKPVGIVCFAWGRRENNLIQTRSQTKQLSGDRQSIREQACIYAIQSLLAQFTTSATR
ncbi:MAG: hypothetical protein RLZZ119_603, partial [Pseudomonadota bacterium]